MEIGGRGGGKGTAFDKADRNLLRATANGMPVIKTNTVDIDPAISLRNIDVGTGHIKVKGSVVVNGNIESGMIVRATGSVTVGGFIESADVQAQGDIIVGQGIIGHVVEEGAKKACSVKTNGSIKSKYAQYSSLQAMQNIELELHSLNNTLMCVGDLSVLDPSGTKGTLSGGLTRVGGKITCSHLGVEGDTATSVQAFVQFHKYKKAIAELRARFTEVQERSMRAIRSEIELKKIPKSQRSEEDNDRLQALAVTKRKNDELLK